MILTGLTARLCCDFKGCTNHINGTLILMGGGGLGFRADEGQNADNWVINLHAMGKMEAFCALHVSHAPKVQLVQPSPGLKVMQ